MIVSEHLGLKFLSFGFITSKYSNKCVHHRVLGNGSEARIVMKHVENAEINMFYKDN